MLGHAAKLNRWRRLQGRDIGCLVPLPNPFPFGYVSQAAGYGLCGLCYLKRAWHGMVEQGYTVNLVVPDEPARGDTCVDVRSVDVRSVLDRLGACLQIARVAAVKEMPASASLPPPSVHLPKHPHACSAAQLEIMEADAAPCPWRDE